MVGTNRVRGTCQKSFLKNICRSGRAFRTRHQPHLPFRCLPDSRRAQTMLQSLMHEAHKEEFIDDLFFYCALLHTCER
jgi:hypothetical protein